MKALIISDIHSNIDALEAVWARESDSDAVFCGGDLVDYGLFPKKVLDWCREHDVRAVQGNHDAHVARLWREKAFAKEGEPFTFAQYNIEQLGREDVEYLESLPERRSFELDGVAYTLFHCNDFSDEWAYTDSLRNFSSLAKFRETWAKSGLPLVRGKRRRIIFGHSHQCCVNLLSDEEIWLNPGSVSYRLGAESWAKGATYIVVQDGEIALRHTMYPSAHLLETVESLNLLPDEKRVGRSFYGPQE